MRKTLTRALLAVTTAAALGFGARQAVAAPSAGSEGEARACTNNYCRNVECYPFYGYCNYALGRCVCAG